MRVPRLALTAQVVFLLECGQKQTDRQTNRQTRLNALPKQAAMSAWVAKAQSESHSNELQ